MSIDTKDVVLGKQPPLIPSLRRAVIKQVLPAKQNMGDTVPFDIHGKRFAPAKGTLIAVTARLKGTVVAKIARANGSPAGQPTKLTTRYRVNSVRDTPGPADTFTGMLADQMIVPMHTSPNADFFYEGAPAAFEHQFEFAHLALFMGAGSNEILVDFGFRAGVPDVKGVSGGASDLTTFDGTLELTYVYHPA